MILNALLALGSVEWKQGTESILISHFSAFEFADEIYRWAKENFLINDVETVGFISNGKNTAKHESSFNEMQSSIINPKKLLSRPLMC
jgi:hypothetical protein